jgi:RNA recognition motif-containing protein
MGVYACTHQVTEDQLRAIFQRFGEIVYVKIPAGKGCGFVQFMGRPNAEAAMLAMNGQVQFPIQILYSRSSAIAPCRHHFSNSAQPTC